MLKKDLIQENKRLEAEDKALREQVTELQDRIDIDSYLSAGIDSITDEPQYSSLEDFQRRSPSAIRKRK